MTLKQCAHWHYEQNDFIVYGHDLCLALLENGWNKCVDVKILTFKTKRFKFFYGYFYVYDVRMANKCATKNNWKKCAWNPMHIETLKLRGWSLSKFIRICSAKNGRLLNMCATRVASGLIHMKKIAPLSRAHVTLRSIWQWKTTFLALWHISAKATISVWFQHGFNTDSNVF